MSPAHMTPESPRHSPEWILRLLLVLLLAGGAWAGVVSLRNTRGESDVLTASGTVEASQVSVASKVPGRILRLHAAEGETVRAGVPLVTIEGRELQAQLAQARAAVAASRARLALAQAAVTLQERLLEAAVAQAEATLEAARTRLQQAREARDLTAAQVAEAVRQAEAALAAARASSEVARVSHEKAARDLARLQALYRDGAVSAQQVDAAQAAVDTARAQAVAAREVVRQAEAALQLARANLRQVEIRQRDVAAAQAQVRQAEAAMRSARAGEVTLSQRRADVAAAAAQVAQAEAGVQLLLSQQENLVLTSPIDGVVVARHAREGEVVAAGAPVLTVADLEEVWVRLFVPLPHLGRVVLGQPVEVRTDALPQRTFHGSVTEIAQQAEFTPKNVQTQEERVKLVFAVKVTIPNPDHLLKPGMPADATIRLAPRREPAQGRR
ncbi:MAG: efflux RND transporter periplasmic adaptor subunit [Armatimonadota bacterium]|nr:efflux RND transporter periplasmic adaptor subunit [Armatimonadota bacterium]